MSTRTTTASAAARIWPGPECLDGTDAFALVAPGRRGVEARARRFVTLTFKWGDAIHHLAHECTQGREIVARTAGIGEGRAKARARMERFVAWLSQHPPCAERAALMVGPSPEYAARSGTLCELKWLAVRVLHGRWREAFEWRVDVDAELSALVASPEWASLLWQRDTSEVAS